MAAPGGEPWAHDLWLCAWSTACSALDAAVPCGRQAEAAADAGAWAQGAAVALSSARALALLARAASAGASPLGDGAAAAGGWYRGFERRLLLDDWPRAGGGRAWPIFGLLGRLLRRGAVPAAEVPRCDGAPEAAAFLRALNASLAGGREVSAAPSVALLIAEAPVGCTPQQTQILRSAAFAALAERNGAWLRGPPEMGGEAPELLRASQLALQEALLPGGRRGCEAGAGVEAASCVEASPLAALAEAPAGVELLELLGRWECARSPLEAGNADVLDCPAPLARASLLDLEAGALAGGARREPLRLAEVGAGAPGACGLWAAQRLLQAGVGRGGVRLLLFEADAARAARLVAGARRHGLHDVTRVVAGAGYVEEDWQDTSLEPRPTLDEALRGNIDWLRIAEAGGQELRVLDGARALFGQREVGALLLALHPSALDEATRGARSDPLSIYEWLVWHGRFVTPTGGRDGAYASVGTAMQGLLAAAGRSVEVLSLPLRPAPPDVEDDGAREFAARFCFRLSAGERPSSWAEVDAKALVANLDAVAAWLGPRRPGGAPAEALRARLGVSVAGAACGHDAALAGFILADAGAGALFFWDASALSRLRDLEASRRCGARRARAVLLRPVADPAALCAVAAAGAAVTVFSVRWLALAGTWAACDAPVRLHLAVDTGLGREGLDLADVGRVARWIALGQLPGGRAGPPAAGTIRESWRLEGLSTKWCCPRDHSVMRAARAIFAAAERALRAAARRGGGRRARRAPLLHVGGLTSDTVEDALGRTPRRWMTRVGSALFGGDSKSLVPALAALRPAVAWRSAVSSLRHAAAGARLGYCPADTDCDDRVALPRDARLAVVPVGFAEFQGKTLRASRGGAVLPVLSAGASTVVVLLPEEGPEMRIGEEVILCDPCAKEELPLSVPRILVNHPTLTTVELCPALN